MNVISASDFQLLEQIRISPTSLKHRSYIGTVAIRAVFLSGNQEEGENDMRIQALYRCLNHILHCLDQRIALLSTLVDNRGQSQTIIAPERSVKQFKYLRAL
jgi:hypothetical protein